MTLISLKSVKNYDKENPTQSPALYTSSFKQGLNIKPYQTVELISFTFNILDQVEIDSTNNVFHFKYFQDGTNVLAENTHYETKKISIPQKIYTKDEICSTLQDLMMEAILIPNFHDIRVSHSSDSSNVTTIKISIQPLVPPTTPNAVDWQPFATYDGNTYNSSTSRLKVSGQNTNEQTLYTDEVNMTGLNPTQFSGRNLSNVLYSKKALFGKGSNVKIDIPKQYRLKDGFDGIAPAQVWSRDVVDFNTGTISSTTSFTLSTATNGSLGDFQINTDTFGFFNVGDLADAGQSDGGFTNVPSWFNYYDRFHYFAQIKNDVTTAANKRDFNLYTDCFRLDGDLKHQNIHTSQGSDLFNEITGFSNKIKNTSSGNQWKPVNDIATFRGGFKTEFGQYANSSVGLSQDLLINQQRATTQFGSYNENTRVDVVNSETDFSNNQTTNALLSDWSGEIWTDLSTNKPYLKIRNESNSPSSSSWRSSQNSIKTQVLEANGVFDNTFVYGTSNLQLIMETGPSTQGNIKFSIGHDGNQTGVYGDFVSFYSGFTNNGSIGTTSRLYEIKFPLRALISYSHGQFLQNVFKTRGIYTDTIPLDRNAQTLQDNAIIGANVNLLKNSGSSQSTLEHEFGSFSSVALAGAGGTSVFSTFSSSESPPTWVKEGAHDNIIYNGSMTSGWASGANVNFPHYLAFEFNEPHILTKYRIWPRYHITSRDQNIRTWELRGAVDKNDYENGNYQVLDTQSLLGADDNTGALTGWPTITSITSSTVYASSHLNLANEYNVSTTEMFKYYVLYITDNYGDSTHTGVGELALYGSNETLLAAGNLPFSKQVKMVMGPLTTVTAGSGDTGMIPSATTPTATEVFARDFSNATISVVNNSNAGAKLGFNNTIYTSTAETDNFNGTELNNDKQTQNLIVEIPELKTEGFNSVNQEKNNAIAFIPSEEITANQQTDVLHYYTNYKQEQMINVKENTTLNQLSVKVTNDEGVVLSDFLKHDTECVIKINDTPESIRREKEDDLKTSMTQNYKYQNVPEYHNGI